MAKEEALDVPPQPQENFRLAWVWLNRVRPDPESDAVYTHFCRNLLAVVQRMGQVCCSPLPPSSRF